MKLLLVIAFVATFVAADAADCSYERLKACYNIEDLLSGNVPKTDDDAVNLCGRLMSGGKCVYDFNNDCVTDAKLRNDLKEVYENLSKFREEICLSPQSRAPFLERCNTCYGLAAVQSAAKEGHQRYVGLVESLLAVAEEPTRKTGLCCAVLYLRENLRGVNEKNCKKEDADYVDQMVVKLFSKNFHDQCGSASDYATCKSALPAASQTIFDDITSANPPKSTQDKYALPSIYKLWKLIPQ